MNLSMNSDFTWDKLEFWKNDLETVSSKFIEGDDIFPPFNLRYRALELTPFDKVKAVILGQDPYHTQGVADGLAFSCGKANYLPPSLANIFSELKSDLNIEAKGVSLEPWAKQGVLLLNTSLTVAKGQPNSHKDIGWSTLAKEILASLSSTRGGLVFILWGNNAQAMQSSILLQENHCILKAPHPSPYSANRGFFGSKPFSRTNEFLASKGISPIDWSV